MIIEKVTPEGVERSLEIANFIVVVIGVSAVIKGIKDKKEMDEYKEKIKKYQDDINRYL